MKITIILGAFLPVPPIRGGAVEKRWFRLAQEFVTCGHHVRMISRTHPDTDLVGDSAGIEHIRVKGYDAPTSPFLQKAYDFLYAQRATRQVTPDTDVVVTNSFWAPLLLPRSLARRAYVDVARMPKGQMRLYRRAARLRANSAVVSAAICSELPAREHRRVSLIPNPLPFSLSDDINLEKRESRLLFCGRVHPEKGLDILVEALGRIRHPWPLDIVGPWDTESGGGGEKYKRTLEFRSARLPVSFLGPIYNASKLDSFYKTAGCFVYPSVAERGETFGLAPLEAMAWGCPPIVSDLACFRDFIRNDENGAVFDHRSSDPVGALAARLQSLMDDTLTRNRLSNQALKVRISHSPPRIGAMFLDDFSSVIKETQQATNAH